MPRLIRMMAMAGALLTLTASAALACPAHEQGYRSDSGYDKDSGYSADNGYGYDNSGPGLTAAEADAYGPTAVAADTAMRPMGNMGGMNRPAMGMPSPAQWAFRSAMNKLWEDHITFTRNFIVATAAGSPSADAIVDRLMQNQTDIGNAIKPYFGADAGNQLTALLKDHIDDAGKVVKAAKAGDTAGMAAANKEWFANADQLAAFLGQANPQYWPEATVRGMLHDHLNLTTDEAKAELTGDWDGSIAAYDKVHKQALQMAGALADGIIGKFPEKF